MDQTQVPFKHDRESAGVLKVRLVNDNMVVGTPNRKSMGGFGFQSSKKKCPFKSLYEGWRSGHACLSII